MRAGEVRIGLHVSPVFELPRGDLVHKADF